MISALEPLVTESIMCLRTDDAMPILLGFDEKEWDGVPSRHASVRLTDVQAYHLIKMLEDTLRGM